MNEFGSKHARNGCPVTVGERKRILPSPHWETISTCLRVRGVHMQRADTRTRHRVRVEQRRPMNGRHIGRVNVGRLPQAAVHLTENENERLNVMNRMCIG